MNIRAELPNSNLETRIEYAVLTMISDALYNVIPSVGHAFLAPEAADSDALEWLDYYRDLNDRMFEINRCDGGF